MLKEISYKSKATSKKSHPEEYSKMLQIESSAKKATEEAESRKRSIFHKAGAMANQVPQWAVISEEIIKAKATTFLQEASRVLICGDIWSKEGLTTSFLGISTRFFSRKDHKWHRLTLAVR